jgi:ADP-ribose pyrophosphatase
MRKRAGVIVYNEKEKTIVLIKRIKIGQTYWVIPGGGVEDFETEKEAAIREMSEELGIKIIDDVHFQKVFSFENHVYYLFKTDYKHDLKIIGEEKYRNANDNQYLLSWVKTDAILGLNILPSGLKKKLISFIDVMNKE